MDTLKNDVRFDDHIKFKDNVWLFRSSPDFALRIQCESDQATTLMHSHECVELVCVYKGTGIHKSGNESVRLNPGDVFVIPSGTKHRYVVEENEHLGLYNLLYSPEAIPLPRLDVCRIPEFERIFTPPKNTSALYLKLNPSQFSEMKSLLRALLNEEKQDRPGFRMCRLGLFMVIITHLIRIYASDTNSYSLDTGIKLVLEHLNRDFRDEINVESLPATCRMSRSKFLRLFKAATGLSPMQYVLRLRINHACCRLAETTASISEIAFECGFSDSSYFTHMFRKYVGTTPKVFRRMARVQSNL